MTGNRERIQEVLNTYIKDARLSEEYEYFGGTILQETRYQHYSICTYCVDDYMDPNGKPYILQGVFPACEHTKRIIVIFMDNDLTIPLPVNSDNWDLVGAVCPEYTQTLDQRTATYLYDRKVLNLNSSVEEITPEEKAEILKLVKRNCKRGSFVVAGLLSFLIWGLSLLLAFAFLIPSGSSDAVYIVSFLSYFVVVIGLTILTTIMLMKIPVAQYKRIKYKREFLYMSASAGKFKTGDYVYGYAHNGFQAIRGPWRCMAGVSRIVNDVQHRDVIYQYSRSQHMIGDKMALFAPKIKSTASENNPAQE